MGTDIDGTIEVRKAPRFPRWEVVAGLGQALEYVRSYDLFACLFGVRNLANFQPLFAERGLPDDAASVTRERYEESLGLGVGQAPSYFTFAEFSRADLDATTVKPDDRIHEFEVVDGREVYRTKSGWSRDAAEAGLYDEHEGKRELRVGNMIFRRVYLTRREALKPFEPALVLLTSLAERWAPDNVRVVAWFED